MRDVVFLVFAGRCWRLLTFAGFGFLVIVIYFAFLFCFTGFW